ncbi:MAG: hypothetical protein RR505_09605 [Raoultibacter sp.]
MLIPISVEKYADMIVKSNHDFNRKELIHTLQMCFTCTTGEADDSDDYEIS